MCRQTNAHKVVFLFLTINIMDIDKYQECRESTIKRYSCQCENKEVRHRIDELGRKHYVYQCIQCGKALPIKKSSPLVMSTYETEPVDKELGNRYSRQMWTEIQRCYDRYSTEKREEFFANYSEYLNSPEWKSKRQRVLERDDYTCQACLKRKATQVHHLTYERLYNEPLFDLVSICDICHQTLHPHMEK